MFPRCLVAVVLAALPVGIDGCSPELAHSALRKPPQPKANPVIEPAPMPEIEASGSVPEPDLESSGEEVESLSDSSKCKSLKKCYSNEDCGAAGVCHGLHVGTCNCTCTDYRCCRNDAGCGGLREACDLVFDSCRCGRVLLEHGYSLEQQKTQLCNVKKCTEGGDECFGMPCNSGNCVCSRR